MVSLVSVQTNMESQIASTMIFRDNSIYGLSHMHKSELADFVLLILFYRTFDFYMYHYDKWRHDLKFRQKPEFKTL